MKTRGGVLVAVLALISLPAAVALIEAVSFYVANRPSGAFVSSGEQREYVLYVPRSYDPTRPTPLVISMHGAGLWGAAQRELSQWNEVAEARGFIVVYPSGATGAGPRIWRVDRSAGLMRDVRFISALIDAGGGLPHRPVADLRQRAVQWRRHGLRAVLRAVRSHRRGRNGGGCANAAVELV